MDSGFCISFPLELRHSQSINHSQEMRKLNSHWKYVLWQKESIIEKLSLSWSIQSVNTEQTEEKKSSKENPPKLRENRWKSNIFTFLVPINGCRKFKECNDTLGGGSLFCRFAKMGGKTWRNCSKWAHDIDNKEFYLNSKLIQFLRDSIRNSTCCCRICAKPSSSTFELCQSWSWNQ